MAIVETASSSANGNSASLSTSSSGVNSGDRVTCMGHNNGTGGQTSDGSNFSEAFQTNGVSASNNYAIWSRLAGGSEPSTYDFTIGGDRWSLIMRAFSGVDATTPFDVTPSALTSDGSGGADATFDANSISINNSGAMGIVWFGADTGASLTFSGITNSYGTEVLAGAQQPGVSYIREHSSTGATGVIAVTPSAANGWDSTHFALAPAAAAGGSILLINRSIANYGGIRQ